MNERNKDQNEGSSFTTFVYADGFFSKGNRHFVQLCINESCSITSDSLQSYGLYSPWNSPGQNTGVASLSLLQSLLNPGIQPRSPTLQADSLPAEPQGKPKNTALGRLSLLQWIFLDLLHCRQILYQLSQLYI